MIGAMISSGLQGLLSRLMGKKEHASPGASSPESLGTVRATTRDRTPSKPDNEQP